jgi:hypothetical protein
MPRIAFTYEGLEKSCEETGDGSSTFDVCTDCFDLNESYDSKNLLLQLGGAYNGEPNPTDKEEVTHHDIGVDNPSLHEGAKVECECCGEVLILNENY